MDKPRRNRFLERTLIMARLSAAVYHPSEEAARMVHDLGYSFAGFVDQLGTQAFVAYKCCKTRLEAVVVFRGTQPGELADWLADLKVCKTKGPLDGRVHQGFSQALFNVWDSIDDLLDNLRFRARQEGLKLELFFTGHSLGGALATIAAASTQERFDPVEYCVSGLFTFGCPRVGSPLFAGALRNTLGPNSIHRWRHHNDVITRAPPAWWNYRHVGKEQYIDRRGNLRRDLGFWSGMWDRLAGRIASRAWRPWRWKTDGISDHAIGEYVGVLEKLIAKETR